MNIVFDSLGGMCPVQGTGIIDGEQFYFRYRHDNAQLYVGGESPLENPRLYAEIRNVTGETDRGDLSEDEAVQLVGRLADDLRPIGEWPAGSGLDQLKSAVETMLEAMRKPR